MGRQKGSLGQLFVPIFLETLLYMLSGMIDTVMLSSVSDNTVAAVGTANTYIGIFIIMFSVVSTGAMAVMTQNIGAKRDGVAYQARQAGLVFNTLFGILLGVFLAVFSGPILKVISISPALFEDANRYLQIVGGFCVFNAIIPMFAGYLRAFGYTKQSLYASLVGNGINLGLNAIFLFVLHWGVTGVAIATVISKCINLLIVMIESKLLIHAKEDSHRISMKIVIKQIVMIGLPSAMETAIYNVAMTLVIRGLNRMPNSEFHVAARSYAAQITNFAYCAGAALASANAILTGWRIGKGDYDACDKGTKKAALIGIVVAISMEGVIALNGAYIMKLFHSTPEMTKMVVTLLTIDIVLEVGRVSNLVFGNALKTSGDTIFPMVIGAIFMFLCAAGGTYFFGLHLGMCVVGAYIGLTLDEVIRAIAMFIRWQTGKWRKLSLVEKS